MRDQRRRISTASVLLVFASGCVLAPGAAKQERAAVARAGAPFAVPFPERSLPDIGAAPAWRDVVARALLANGEVEAAYFEWAAAVHRIERAGAYPNTPLSLDFAGAIRGGGKGFDRTMLGLGFDPMENLAFPTKVYQAAKVAIDEARAAGARFITMRLDVQRRVLATWTDYALAAERLRVQRERTSWLQLLDATAAARVAAGGSRQEQARTEIELRRAESEATTLADTTLPQLRSQLNAMMAREPDAPLTPPAAIEARPLPIDDALLLAQAAAHDPALAALAHEVEGRRDALALARLQYIPDFNPFVSTEGAATQAAGMVISIPTMLREVGAMIRESRAELRATEARYRQTRDDRTAAVVAALSIVRNGERVAALFDGVLRRAAGDVVASAQVAYASNTGSYADVVGTQEAVLDLRLLVAEARASREKALGDLEALVGVDAETLTARAAAPPGAATARTEVAR